MRDSQRAKTPEQTNKHFKKQAIFMKFSFIQFDNAAEAHVQKDNCHRFKTANDLKPHIKQTNI